MAEGKLQDNSCPASSRKVNTDWSKRVEVPGGVPKKEIELRGDFMHLHVFRDLQCSEVFGSALVMHAKQTEPMKSEKNKTKCSKKVIIKVH